MTRLGYVHEIGQIGPTPEIEIPWNGEFAQKRSTSRWFFLPKSPQFFHNIAISGGQGTGTEQL